MPSPYASSPPLSPFPWPESDESHWTLIMAETHLNTSRRRAPALLDLFYEDMATLSCPMYDAAVGWGPNEMGWCMMVRLIEPVDADPNWAKVARERFTDLVLNTDDGSARILRGKEDRFNPSMRDRNSWKHLSLIAVWRGIPFLLCKDGERQAADEFCYMMLLDHLGDEVLDLHAFESEARAALDAADMLRRLNPSGNAVVDMPRLKREDKIRLTAIVMDPRVTAESAEELAGRFSRFLLEKIGCENFSFRFEYHAKERHWVVSLDLLEPGGASSAGKTKWLSDIRSGFIYHFGRISEEVMDGNGRRTDRTDHITSSSRKLRQATWILGYRGVALYLFKGGVRQTEQIDKMVTFFRRDKELKP
ncbi:hypothetical protein BDW74DRAFT_183319 [Aspergillus multicolor]|uniref:uncharacterized protein n=1 Tax=Aspergillus multicolor TaxID=41759 RepID=UPI003CCD4AEA